MSLGNRIFIFFLYSILVTNMYSQNTTDALTSFSIHKNGKHNKVIKSESLLPEDTLQKTRLLLFDEMRAQLPDVETIANLQAYLNRIHALSNEENIILYIYLNKWDSVLHTIPKLVYPYKINMLSVDSDKVYVFKGNNSFTPIEKDKFVNEKSLLTLSESTLSEEQKEFLTLFTYTYLGYQRMQDGRKVKVAYRDVKQRYPNSKYLKYILISNKVYHRSNWH